MDIGWQQEVNIADSPIETGAKAPGPVLARPQYLVHVGKRCVDRPLRQRLKPAIARPSAFALLRRERLVVARRARSFWPYVTPPAALLCPDFYSRLPRTLRSRFQGQSPNSSMFFHL